MVRDLIKSSPRAGELSDIQLEQIYQTIKCESKLYPSAKGDYASTTGYMSFGLAQINMRWHPEVSEAQALDPDFAVPWMVIQFVKGKQREWTCWRNLYAFPDS